MKIKCPQCQKVFNAPDTYIGKKVKCLKCNHSFIVNSLIDKQQGIQENTAKDRSLINLKTTTTSDKILRLAFRFAKGISASIVAICFINLIGCVIALFVVQPKKVPVRQQLSLPDFSEFKQQVENQRTQQTTQNASEYTQRSVPPSQSIEGQFGEQLNDIDIKYGLNRQILIRWLVELQNQNRTLFLSGLKTFLADAQEYYSKGQKQSAFTYANFADYYHEAFGQAEQQYEADIASALAHNKSEMERINTIRKLILMSLAGSIGCLLAFLILPLLIQIERNTRVLLAEK
jgi:DNA-directed RNA polymerase subunit M/transcription elongation factor TFIIS